MFASLKTSSLATLSLLILLLAMTGCEKETTAPVTEPSAQAQTAAPAVDTPAPATGGTLEVAASGTKFDPPVQAAALPDKAWFCDMGTVHYAAMEKGDGKCPTCGMMLVQKGAPAVAHDHGEHAPGDGEHAHDDEHEHGDGHTH